MYSSEEIYAGPELELSRLLVLRRKSREIDESVVTAPEFS